MWASSDISSSSSVNVVCPRDRPGSSLCLKESANLIWNVLRPFLSSLKGGERRDLQGGYSVFSPLSPLYCDDFQEPVRQIFPKNKPSAQTSGALLVTPTPWELYLASHPGNNQHGLTTDMGQSNTIFTK